MSRARLRESPGKEKKIKEPRRRQHTSHARERRLVCLRRAVVVKSRMRDVLPEALAALWALAYLFASRRLPRIFGKANVGGMELWRSVWALPTQFVLFPVALMIRGEVADRLFMYVFALYMVLDLFLAGHLDFIFYIHHAVCVFGHTIVISTLRAAFDLPGVVALELGSGAMNVWALTRARFATVLYALGMTASNAAASYLSWQWSQLPIAPAPKAICLIVALALIVLRQRACHENVRIGAPRHLLHTFKQRLMQRWSKIYLTPKYLAATFLTVVTPLVLLEFMSREIGLSLFVFFGFLGVGRAWSVSQEEWRAAETSGRQATEPLVLERNYLVNRHRLKLRRFTIQAERPKAACILVHGYGQSAHFEFLCATYRAGHIPPGTTRSSNPSPTRASRATRLTCRGMERARARAGCVGSSRRLTIWRWICSSSTASSARRRVAPSHLLARMLDGRRRAAAPPRCRQSVTSPAS